MNLFGLYAITDNVLTPVSILKESVESALAGGAKLVQLRDKQSSDEDLLSVAEDLYELCDSYDALFIINDRVGLAARCGCHGVHIGREDGEFSHAREMLPDKIIGVSCYGDLERAERMQSKGADYVAFGSMFPSPTKPEAKRVNLSFIEEAKKSLDIPVCVIGGINLDNAMSLVDMGADMVAVISGLWGAKSAKDRALSFSRMFEV